jgi:hypothetical protein
MFGPVRAKFGRARSKCTTKLIAFPEPWKLYFRGRVQFVLHFRGRVRSAETRQWPLKVPLQESFPCDPECPLNTKVKFIS